jgi:hypothetical protein
MANPVNLPSVLTRVTFIGLVMNVMVPTTLLVVMALFRGDVAESAGISWQEQSKNQMFVYILLAVAVVDLVTAGIIRRRPPRSVIGISGLPPAEQFEKSVMSLFWLIFSLNLSCTFYGLVLVVIGLRIEVMMLFVALTLIGYQVLRPRQKFLEAFWSRLEQARTGRGDGFVRS